FSVALALSLLLGFQNCNKSGSHKTSSSIGGNGGVYEGKPYYQVLPGFTCENQPAPSAVAYIDTTNDTASLAVNSADKCVSQAQAQPVSWAAVELVLRPWILAVVDERIMERTDTPDLTSNTYWETYCESDPFQSTPPQVNVAIKNGEFLYAEFYWPG